MRALLLLLPLFAGGGGCWDLNNPCDPVCPPGKTCRLGACVEVDAALPDGGAPDLGDGGRKIWAKQLGNKYRESANAVAVSGKDGKIVVAGSYTSATAALESDPFVAAYTTAGDLSWTTSFTGSAGDHATSVALASSWTIHVFGHFFGWLQDSNNKLILQSNGQADGMWLVLDWAGKLQRATRFGLNGYVYGNGVAANDKGQLALVGHVSDPVFEMGGDPLDYHGGGDGMIGLFDADGGHRWSSAIGGTKNDHARAVAFDPWGNLLVAGSYQGLVDFGGGEVHVSRGGADAFLLKLDSGGKTLWVQTFGSAKDDSAGPVAVDVAGNVYLAASVSGPVTLGGRTLPYVSDGDGVLTSFDKAGQHRWSQTLGGNRADSFAAVAVNGAGELLVGANFSETTRFGGVPTATAIKTDFLVAKLSGAGRLRWLRHFGGPGDDVVRGLAVGPGNEVVAVGYFYETLELGKQKLLESNGEHDPFILKLSR